jgi:hypothetical protein
MVGKVFPSKPLNSIRVERRMASLSAADKEELATWFTSMATNTDPNNVMPIPDCYKPVAAWLQMYSNDIINEQDTDMKPWNMPSEIVEYWADVWYANRVGMLRAFQEQKANHDEAHGLPSGALFGIHSDPNKRTGRA